MNKPIKTAQQTDSKQSNEKIKIKKIVNSECMMYAKNEEIYTLRA